jgi:DNA-binding GntR family transcriptional regulator
MQNFILHNDLSTPVYKRLKEMIEQGELQPGQKLIQEKLAANLGVSRTPLLKALQNLEYEMLVESVPRRGMYVRQISTQEMIDVYDCREAIESMAVKLLIDRAEEKELEALKAIFEPFLMLNKIDTGYYAKADEKFHNMIIQLSGNPLLKKMSGLSEIHKKVYRFGLVRSPNDTLLEHEQIVAAIIKRDYKKADQEIRNHIDLSRKVLINKLEEEK